MKNPKLRFLLALVIFLGWVASLALMAVVTSEKPRETAVAKPAE